MGSRVGSRRRWPSVPCQRQACRLLWTYPRPVRDPAAYRYTRGVWHCSRRNVGGRVSEHDRVGGWVVTGDRFAGEAVVDGWYARHRRVVQVVDGYGGEVVEPVRGQVEGDQTARERGLELQLGLGDCDGRAGFSPRGGGSVPNVALTTPRSVTVPSTSEVIVHCSAMPRICCVDGPWQAEEKHGCSGHDGHEGPAEPHRFTSGGSRTSGASTSRAYDEGRRAQRGFLVGWAAGRSRVLHSRRSGARVQHVSPRVRRCLRGGDAVVVVARMTAVTHAPPHVLGVGALLRAHATDRAWRRPLIV